MTTRFKRLLWKTAIKLHKQTRGDKTSLKRQKQHKESQNTKKTGYRHKGSSAAETRWVLSASWEILQLSVQQHSSGMFRVTWSSLNPETNHICVHATDACNHIFTPQSLQALCISWQLWTRDFLRFYWFLHFPAAVMWLKWTPADTQVSQVRRCWRKP